MSLRKIIRPATASDINYVRKSWLQSYRNSAFGRSMTTDLYYAAQSPLIESALQDSRVDVSCLEVNPDDLCGFVVHSRTSHGLSVIHYLYSRSLFRNEGVARALFESVEPTSPTICTHDMPIFRKFRSRENLINLREYEMLLKIDPVNPQEAYYERIINKNKGTK